MKKVWQIYAMECYLTIKRIKIFYLEQHRWILEDIMLKEVSHTEKDTYCLLIHSLIFFISTLQFSTQRSYANSELKSVSQTYSVFNVITNLTSEAIELCFFLDTDTFPTSITSMAMSQAFYYTDLRLLQYFKVFHMLTMITYLGYLSPMILHFWKSLNSLELSVS